MMNNTTSEICFNHFQYDQAVRLSYILWRSFGLLCILFGIPGHLLQIVIAYKRTNQKETTSLYFAAIAACELLFLLGILWLWCVGMSVTRIDPRQILSCGLFYSIFIGPTILSNLYLASISVDRTILILSPMRYRVLITRQHVLRRILVILLIVIISMVPHQFYYYYNKTTTLFICEFHPSPSKQFRIRLWPFAHAILFVSLPSLITCLASVILLHNRCKHRRITRNRLSENARRMERNAILIVFVSIAILFFLLPTVVLEIFLVHDRLFRYQTSSCAGRQKKYRILLNCFFVLASVNYSFKFYIRLIISKTFRRDFSRLFSQKNDSKREEEVIRLYRQTNTASHSTTNRTSNS